MARSEYGEQDSHVPAQLALLERHEPRLLTLRTMARSRYQVRPVAAAPRPTVEQQASACSLTTA